MVGILHVHPQVRWRQASAKPRRADSGVYTYICIISHITKIIHTLCIYIVQVRSCDVLIQEP